VETREPVGELNAEHKNHWRQTLFTNLEGRILLVGVAIAFVYSLWLGAKVWLSPSEAQDLAGTTAMAILFGRAAGLAFGYSQELGRTTVIAISAIVETVFVLIVYPLFVFSWRRLLVIGRLKNTFEKIQQAAEARQDLIKKYGIIGLFAFVWFPFWMTGPVVGSVIGFLLGLPVWLTMTVVLAGTYTAIVGWAFFMHHCHERAAAYSTYAPMILVAALVIVVIAGHLLQRTVHAKRNKTSGQ